MKRIPAILFGAALLLALSACGGSEVEAPGAATQRGIDRSVADIQAAEAATRGPVEVSRSVGELTGKASAEASGEPAAKAKGTPAAG